MHRRREACNLPVPLFLHATEGGVYTPCEEGDKSLRRIPKDKLPRALLDLKIETRGRKTQCRETGTRGPFSFYWYSAPVIPRGRRENNRACSDAGGHLRSKSG